MTVLMTIDRDAAKTNPEREFDTPEQIAGDIGFTRAEKIKALQVWQFDIERRQEAADEGMLAEQAAPRALSDDADLLRRIGVQLDKLKSEI